MKKPKIVVRFSASSKNDKTVFDYEKIKKLLPESNSSYIKGDKKVLTDKRVYPSAYKETSFDYKLSVESFELEEAHSKWFDLWTGYFEVLKSIKKQYEFSFYINYEITVYSMDYPSMYFPVEYSTIFSEIGIDLSLYIYNEN